MKLLRIRLALSAAAFLALGLGRRAEADLTLYVEDPTVQVSQVSGAGVSLTTEDFNGFSTGKYTPSLSTAVGKVSSAGNLAIVAANAFGGAGGAGNYFSIGAQSGTSNPATLVTLGGGQAYFGFWWSAADAENQVSFFQGGTLLGSFNTPFILAKLKALSNGNDYFGNPNNGDDGGEPFVYLNIVASNGQSITSVVFANSGSTGTGFESDNWPIASTAPTGGLGTKIEGGFTTPEPSSFAIVGISALCGLAYSYRRRTGQVQA